MSTKSIFDVPLPLTRAALLRLLRGETVEARNSPLGATMIEGVAKVALHEEVTDAERRAIGDALTRSVPDSYLSGYSTASWTSAVAEVGTSEWLTMIASNADRIRLTVLTPDGRGTEARYLADCTPEQQSNAVRSWLRAGMTPVWQRHVPQDEPKKVLGLDPALIAELNTAAGFSLDRIGSRYGIERSLMTEAEEGDASYRQRIQAAMQANEEVLRRHREAPPPPPRKSPREEAAAKVSLIRWIAEQSHKVGSAWSMTGSEHEFLKSCETRAKMGEPLSAKQEQWLEDLLSKAKQKASTIAHLLPPIPKF